MPKFISIPGTRSDAVKFLTESDVSTSDVRMTSGGHIWSVKMSWSGAVLECHLLHSGSQDGMLCWHVTTLQESELDANSPTDCPADMLNMVSVTNQKWRDLVAAAKAPVSQEQNSKQRKK